jgi:DNA-binding beta-propeller fold protein YncE
MLIPEPEHQFVYVFDLKEEIPTLISQFGQRGTKFDMFIRPAGVRVNEADRVALIADPSTCRLQQFKLAFEPDGPLDFNPFMARLIGAMDLSHPRFNPAAGVLPWRLRPEAIRRDFDGNLHVLDRLNALAVVIDREMKWTRSYGGFGSGSGQLCEPSDLALTRDGAMCYVVDAGNFRVQGFDRAGQPTVAFGTFGAGPGQFRQPFGIAVDDQGFIYVSDALADRIQKFDSNGRYVSEWGARGINHGEFWRPLGLAIDSRNRLFVIDHGNHRAQMFTLDGQWLGTFGGGRPVGRSDME